LVIGSLDSIPYYHFRAGTTQKIFTISGIDNAGANIVYSDDNGTTSSDIDISPEEIGTNLAVAPDGLYMMGNWDYASGKRGRSSDGGNTWSGIPNLPPGGVYTFGYAGGLTTASRWIAARGIVRYTPDFGETWEEKTGNLIYLIPVSMSIIIVRVPGV
jgi:hypothetical protein